MPVISEVGGIGRIRHLDHLQLCGKFNDILDHMGYCPPKTGVASEKSIKRTGGWDCHVDIKERKEKGKTDSTAAPRRGVTGIFLRNSKEATMLQSELMREDGRGNRTQVLGFTGFQRSTWRLSW